MDRQPYQEARSDGSVLVRPVTVVIVHFDDCHGVIIIFY